MHMSVESQPMNKRHSPFFVKDILGLSDESENESDQAMDSGDDQSFRESSTEESLENLDDASCGKKTRQCFTSKQVEELERLFNETNYPDAYTRQMLAKRMNVSETRIQIWCQNRRAKLRRQRKQRKPMLHGLSSPHSCYYPSSGAWLQPHINSMLPFPVLPSPPHRSPVHSPLSFDSPSRHCSSYRSECNKDDICLHRDLIRAKHDYHDLEYGRIRSYTR
eukprot:TCONS_00023447-protein